MALLDSLKISLNLNKSAASDKILIKVVKSLTGNSEGPAKLVNSFSNLNLSINCDSSKFLLNFPELSKDLGSK